MKNNIWQSYQPGQASSVLPPGYMEAATAPGRAIGQGIQSGMQSLAAGIQQRGMMQRQDAQDAKQLAREAEQEAKQIAKQRSANEALIRAYKPDVDPREIQLLGSNEVEGLARQLQLQHQLQKDQQEMDARKLATQMQVKQFETSMADRDERQRGIAAYMESMGMPEWLRNPRAGYAIAGNFPAAAVDIAKMMPDPQKQMQFVTDPETGQRFFQQGNSVGQVQMPQGQKDRAALAFSPDGKYFHDGNAWKPVPFKEMKIDPVVWMTASPEQRALMLKAFTNGNQPAQPASGAASEPGMFDRFTQWNKAK